MYFERKRHDTDGPFFFELLEDDGSAADLSLATSLTMCMKSEDGTTTKIDNVALTVVDAAKGWCKYQPLAADVDTAGTFRIEVEATRTGRGKKTWPTKKGGMVLIIHPDLNAA